ncbi:unnamed protein product [Mytilus coruscus]|uniref:Uncharacterized protein n=1 Tax=Mytilus coruscus TaxID=42192 RepID=A0A6J8E826_MYTCO|nr:unnamed protein product [Mytilus coruscus]
MKKMFESKIDKLRNDVISTIDEKIRILKADIDLNIARESSRLDDLVNSVQTLSIRVGQVENFITNPTDQGFNNQYNDQGVKEEVNADIFSIRETHLKEIDEIEVDGYTWKGFNRQYIHMNAPKASGGVGLSIKNWIFEKYKYETIDITRDGVICGNIPVSPTQSTKRFKLKLMPNDMFSPDMCKLALQNVVSHTEQTRETQENIDNIYTKLCDVIIKEMNEKIPVFNTSGSSKKTAKGEKAIFER